MGAGQDQHCPVQRHMQPRRAPAPRPVALKVCSPSPQHSTLIGCGGTLKCETNGGDCCTLCLACVGARNQTAFLKPIVANLNKHDKGIEVDVSEPCPQGSNGYGNR